ncbi:hypothetical protein LMA04_20155 [Pseudescherichia vulneris]|uniref:hypothetical protein n=1 Tax=Pseudescherichia vulneris TaxID=566 RepID=UPI00227CC5E4|nr:hypothetical protein [Pseudescherichia vulneris]WAH52357.1 hypothetical protein LMA04_20155 [Pseudescherichia vulneris]
MKTSHEKTVNDAEVEALLAAIDSSSPEQYSTAPVQISEERTIAHACEMDIHDSSVAELDR